MCFSAIVNINQGGVFWGFALQTPLSILSGVRETVLPITGGLSGRGVGDKPLCWNYERRPARNKFSSFASPQGTRLAPHESSEIFSLIAMSSFVSRLRAVQTALFHEGSPPFHALFDFLTAPGYIILVRIYGDDLALSLYSVCQDSKRERKRGGGVFIKGNDPCCCENVSG